MPVKLSCPCALVIKNAANGKAVKVLITGGWSTNEALHRTDFYDLDPDATKQNKGWTKGPDMNKRRHAHSCGTSNQQGLKIAIVAGGVWKKRGNKRTSSTEILRLDQANPKWNAGPNLPKILMGAAGLTTKDGRFLFIRGNVGLNTHMTSILELKCNAAQVVGKTKPTPLKNACKWITLTQKLKEARSMFVAMMIPKEKLVC